jgi:hypothetical protein
MSLRLGSLAFSLLLILAGGALLARSSHMAEWKNPTRAADMMVMTPPEIGDVAYRTFMQRWHEERDTLRTEKWALFDFGTSLIALAVCLVATCLLLRIKRLCDIVSLKTPSRKWLILGLGLIAWFGLFLAAWQGFLNDYQREEFPPWADSMGIPLSGLSTTALLGCLVLTPLAWFLALRNAALPVDLWIWRHDAPLRSWFFSICAGISLCFGALELWGAFESGPYLMVPVVFLWIYATLAVRAAGISWQQTA